MSRLAHCVIAFLLLSLSAQAATYYECLVLVGTNGGYASLVDPGKATPPSQYYYAHRADLPSGPWVADVMPTSLYSSASCWLPFPTNVYELPIGVVSQANFAVSYGTNDFLVYGATYQSTGTTWYYFDGVEDNLHTKNGTLHTGGVTIAAWIFKARSGTLEGVTTFASENNTVGTRADQLAFTAAGNIELDIIDAQSDVIYATTPSFGTGAWNHVIASWNGSLTTNGFNMWTNGVICALVCGSVGSMNIPSATNNDLWVGRLSSSYFKGSLDDVQRFGKGFTHAEATNLFSTSCEKYGKSKL